MPASGPWAPLATALAAAILGILCGLLAWLGPFSATSTAYAALSIVGWVLCGVIALVMVGVYTIQDSKVRAASFYVANTTQLTVRGVTLGLALAGVILTAFEIALWVSKL